MKIKFILRHSVITLAALALTSCSLLSPVANKTPNKFVLDRAPLHISSRASHTSTLMVSVPVARQIYDTTQMAYTKKAYQIEYFSQNQWAEAPAQMLQPLLVKALQSTHHFHAIIVPPTLDHYEYSLDTQLLKFEEDFTYRIPRFNMTMRAQLSRTSVNQVVATREFSVSEEIPQATPYGGVIAANRASERILAEITRFCLEHAG